MYLVYSDFRNKKGEFFSNLDGCAEVAAARGADHFWHVAGSRRGEKACELFRKLCNGYCGQGAAERMNKLVKKIRNKLRNRQTHDVTQAWLFLASYYKRKHEFRNEARRIPLELIKEQIDEIVQLVEDDDCIEHEETIVTVDDEVENETTAMEGVDEMEEEVEEVEDVAGNCLIDVLVESRKRNKKRKN